MPRLPAVKGIREILRIGLKPGGRLKALAPLTALEKGTEFAHAANGFELQNLLDQI